MVAVARAVGLWGRLVGARVRAQLQYRTSFALDALASFGLTFVDFVAVLALFTHFRALAGWSIGEVAFLYGAGGIGFALGDLLLGHVEDTNVLIRNGQFDVILLRPAGSLTQVIASDLSLRRVGKVVQAAVVLGYALTRVEIDWNLGRVLMLLVIVTCGAAIFAAVWILGACLTFWTVNSGEVGNAFSYGGNFMSQYPLDIFGPWLRRFMGFVIPTAFVVYFPALYVLDKDDPFGLPGWLRFASPLVAVAALSVARVVWHVAVRHYRSTGS